MRQRPTTTPPPPPTKKQPAVSAVEAGTAAATVAPLQRVCSIVEGVSCPVCHFSFPSQHLLVVHMKDWHPSSPAFAHQTPPSLPPVATAAPASAAASAAAAARSVFRGMHKRAQSEAHSLRKEKPLHLPLTPNNGSSTVSSISSGSGSNLELLSDLGFGTVTSPPMQPAPGTLVVDLSAEKKKKKTPRELLGAKRKKMFGVLKHENSPGGLQQPQQQQLVDLTPQVLIRSESLNQLADNKLTPIPLFSYKKMGPPKTSYEAAALIQATWRAYVTKNWFKSQVHRSRVVHELLSTEDSYCNSLCLLINNFVAPIREAQAQGRPVISVEDAQYIFSQVEAVLAFNMRTLALLRERITTWNIDSSIGDVLATLASTEMLQLYSQYTTTYNAVSQRFATLLEENSHFRKFVEGVERRLLEGGHRAYQFYALSIMPVQRPPRYALLFKEINKYTAFLHSDYKDVHIALKAMESLCAEVNENKRADDKESDRLQKLCEIGNKIKPKLLNLTGSTQRFFLREGPIQLFDSDRYLITHRYFFLFSDLLIVTKPRRNAITKEVGYSLKHMISLTSVKVKPAERGPIATSGERMRCALELATTSRTLTFGCGSDAERATLLGEISAACSLVALP
eukprot:TRINITY_DN1210_c0_g1_i2.p1 TRINITY_DN1210_c0_g1~~TRINITY_DN1210_c0_g1_i2.p1  ORF type:complete len:624 (-),score=139.04 TRINITY_DN1210_c0_g1_i2:69-1940(-)